MEHTSHNFFFKAVMYCEFIYLFIYLSIRPVVRSIQFRRISFLHLLWWNTHNISASQQNCIWSFPQHQN